MQRSTLTRGAPVVSDVSLERPSANVKSPGAALKDLRDDNQEDTTAPVRRYYRFRGMSRENAARGGFVSQRDP